MKKSLLLLPWLLCAVLFAWAQTRQIKGRVTDEDGKPIAGVSVLSKASPSGAITDMEGRFTISITGSGSVDINFSSQGYELLTVHADGSQPLNVTMKKAVSSLEDVVVVGYGTQRRRDLTASVSSVSAKDLKDMPVNSAAEILNGRLAGVTATTAEGSPDADVRVRVRGGMSITGDNSPLYIIDGVQMENALSFISPQDIQSIDVLKDAAATAIYGARGANGVIIITTKSGKRGKPVISYNGFVGIKKLAKELKVLNPYDYVFYQSERSRGSVTDSTNFTDDFGHSWDTLDVYKSIGKVDWQKETFGRTGITTTHNVSVAGGSKAFTYDFGYTYNNEKAIVLNSNYRRHLFNFKGDYNVTSNIKVGGSVRYTHQEVLGAGVSDDKGSAYNRLRNSVKYRPFLSSNQSIDQADPLADPNVGNGLTLVNPLQLSNAEYRNKTTNTFAVTAYGSYNIVKNLNFRTTFGYVESERRDLQFYDSIAPYAIIQGGAKPIARLDTSKYKTITNSNVLSYTVNNYKGKHDFSVLVGEETYDLRTDLYSNLFGYYPTFTPQDVAFKQTSLGTAFTGYPNVHKSRYTNLSFFGLLNYAYRDKYLFSFNVRRDGASKFAPGKQWGTFPAASVAWRVKSEKFMEDVRFIDDMKFRLGYGSIGNNRIDDYLYLTSFANDGRYYYGIGGEPVLAYYSPSLVNQDLRWESMVNRNIGLDLTLFNRRVDLSIDYYNNSSKDLLLNVPVASTFGYSTQYQNIGKTKNTGVEIQLNTVIMRRPEGLNWNANFNISFNKNEIVALGRGQDFFYAAPAWGVSGQPADYIQQIGSPVGSMYGLVSDGFYKVSDFNYDPSSGIYTLKSGVVDNSGIIGPVQPGSVKFKDLNGDGVIDLDHDRKIIGNPTPKFTGGLAQQFRYKRWDLSFFVNFSVGNDVYNANKIEFTNGYTPNANLLAMMGNRWKTVTPDGQTAQWVNGNTVYGIAPDQLAALNQNASIWQPIRGAGAFYPTSWAIEDGSFLRFNNLTIGYSLPAKSISRLKMSQLRFYFTANNFGIITRYSGYDPEVSVRSNPLTPGLDYSAYPKSRSFIIGVNASF